MAETGYNPYESAQLQFQAPRKNINSRKVAAQYQTVMKRCIVILCLVIFFPFEVLADDILVLLKDGRTIKSQGAWEFEDDVMYMVNGQIKTIPKIMVASIVNSETVQNKGQKKKKQSEEEKTICHIYFLDGRHLEKNQCAVIEDYVQYFSGSSEVKIPKHIIAKVILTYVADGQEQEIYSNALATTTEDIDSEALRDGSVPNSLKRMEAESISRARQKQGFGKDYSISSKIYPGMKIEDVLIILGPPDYSQDYRSSRRFPGGEEKQYNRYFRYKTTMIYFWNNEVSWVEEGYQ